MRIKFTFTNLIFLIFSALWLSACGGEGNTQQQAIPKDSIAQTQEIKDISRQIEANAGNAELYYRRARLYDEQKYLNRAEDDYLAAIRLDSLNPLYHFSLGRTLYAMNQTKRAADSYEKALQLKPDYIEALMKLSDLYFVVREYDKSLALLSKGIKQDPGNAYLYHMMGMNYRDKGDTGRAIYHFQTAFENDPQDFESALYMANLYAAQKKQVALEYYNAAIKIKPKNVDAWFGRAVFFQKGGNFKQALKDYRKVIDLDPANYLAYYNVGYLNYDARMPQEALRNWNICSEMNPEYSPVFYMKGLQLEELGKKQEALINYKVAIQLEPENALYQSAISRIQK